MGLCAILLLHSLALSAQAQAQDQAQPIRLFPLTDVGPEYPVEAFVHEVEGWVLVQFTVSAQGAAGDIRISDSEPPVTFDQAAIEATRKFQFEPYVENGVAREVAGVEYLFRFGLSENTQLAVPEQSLSLNNIAERSRDNQRRPSITQIANEDRLPVFSVPPIYPTTAVSENLGGWVLVRFAVTSVGSVINAEVVDSEPVGVFDESAIQAIEQFEYEPQSTERGAVSTADVFHMFKFRPSI